MNKPAVATGKTLLNGVTQKRVTVSVDSSHSASFLGTTSQSEGIEIFRIFEEQLKLSASVIKEFENDEIDGKVNIHDNDYDSTHLSLVDHDEMRDMPTTAELNRGSAQLEREAELNADAVAEGRDTCETVSVIDQRVAHLSSDVRVKLELIVKDSSGGNLAVRQLPESRTTTASHPPLSSSIGINQSSLLLSSTLKKTPINSTIFCND
uniref:Uncharacterized protein n=1 Tax=Trichobilharzia regenti TaxID=157069 RepID=A0AA85KG48_TRIRE|nr:unnamed protein product [Trichobilharzia regenti]